MISFLDEEMRLRFHELPIDKQLEWQSLADHYPAGITILFVEQGDGGLEVSVRINEEP